MKEALHRHVTLSANWTLTRRPFPSTEKQDRPETLTGKAKPELKSRASTQPMKQVLPLSVPSYTS